MCALSSSLSSGAVAARVWSHWRSTGSSNSSSLVPQILKRLSRVVFAGTPGLPSEQRNRAGTPALFPFSPFRLGRQVCSLGIRRTRHRVCPVEQHAHLTRTCNACTSSMTTGFSGHGRARSSSSACLGRHCSIWFGRSGDPDRCPPRFPVRHAAPQRGQSVGPKHGSWGLCSNPDLLPAPPSTTAHAPGNCALETLLFKGLCNKRGRAGRMGRRGGSCVSRRVRWILDPAGSVCRSRDSVTDGLWD
jgi:hypothetical protein